MPRLYFISISLFVDSWKLITSLSYHEALGPDHRLIRPFTTPIPLETMVRHAACACFGLLMSFFLFDRIYRYAGLMHSSLYIPSLWYHCLFSFSLRLVWFIPPVRLSPPMLTLCLSTVAVAEQ
jgi:hypothetical protein